METGLVAIDFTGVATSYFATSARVKADLAEIKKMQAEIVIPGIPGGVGGSGGIAQSVESQIAPVRAASMERRKIYKEEAEARGVTEMEAERAMDNSINKELAARRAFLQTGKNDYDEYLSYLKARTIKNNEEIAAANKAAFSGGVPGAIETNIAESRIAGGGFVPLPLPAMAERRAMPTVEEQIASGGLSNWEKAYGARRIESGLRGINMEEGLGGMIAGGSNLLSGIAPFGILTGHPLIATGIGLTAGAGFLTAESMKQFGTFQSSAASLQAITKMSEAARKAFEQAALDLSGKPGKKELEMNAANFLDAAKIIISMLQLSGPDIDQNMPALMGILNTVYKYAVATNGTITQAATDLMGKVKTTGFRIGKDQEAAKQEFEKEAALFAESIALGSLTSPSQLGAAIRKVGGLAQFEGVPTSETLAAMQVMAGLGDKGQVVGTALRQIMLGLSGARGPSLDKALEPLGASFSDISLQNNGLFGAIQNLQKITGFEPGKPPSREATALMSKIFGSRWIQFFAPMVQYMPEMQKVQGELAQGGAQDLETMFNLQTGTLQAKEGEVGRKIQNVFTRIGEGDEKNFSKLVDDIGRLVDDVQKAEPAFAKFTDLFVKMIDGIMRLFNLFGYGGKGTAPPLSMVPRERSNTEMVAGGLGGIVSDIRASTLEGQLNIQDQRFNAWWNQNRGKPGAEAKRQRILTDMQNIEAGIDEYSQTNITEKSRKAIGDALKKSMDDLSATMGYAPGFGIGGYTGDIDPREPAGVVHGGEFVFDAVSTRRAGVERLRALQKSLRGYWAGGPVNPYDPSQVSDPAIASGGDGISIDSLLSLGTAIARAAPGSTASNIASGLSFFSSVHSPADMLGKIAGDFGNAFGFFQSDNNKGRGVHRSFLQSVVQRLSNPGTYLTLASDVLSHNWSGALASTLGGHAADIGSNSIGVLNEILGALKAQKLAVPINARSEEVLGGFQYEDDQTSFE